MPEVLIKKEASTNPNYGCVPEKRPIETLINCGIVNIDKPCGPTSHQVSSYVQKILDIKKAGHSGSLDPKVTGVLPIALGRATKIVEVLLKSPKEYVGIMHLHSKVEENRLREVIRKFIGEITQLPPLRSAVKRKPRTKKIYFIKILEIENKDVLFKVGCEAGTYIRKLCHDIGLELGCGAHMKELRRIKAGPYDESTLITLQDLKDAYWFYKNENNEKFLRHCIQPIESAIKYLPKVWVLDSTVNSVCNGVDLKVPGIAKLEQFDVNDLIAILTLKNELVALGISQISSVRVMKEDKGIAVITKKVFMSPGTYPKSHRT